MKIIAAVKNTDALMLACKSDVEMIFDIQPNIELLENYIEICKKFRKKLFVHIDLAEGIGKDKYGLKFVQKMGVDGIISTRAGMIKAAKELGMETVQRIFILDSHSLETAEAVLKTEPDMVEVMPGVIPVAIEELCGKINIPVIAGGLVRSVEDVELISKAGAVAVSTSENVLWKK